MKVSIKGHPLEVSLAEDDLKRAEGLMGVKSMPEDHGMLFRWPSAEPRSFWMKDTHIPLDIAFIANDGKILNIEQMAPYSLKSNVSTGPAACALEVNSGWFKKHGIVPGDIVDGVFNFRKVEKSEERLPNGK